MYDEQLTYVSDGHELVALDDAFLSAVRGEASVTLNEALVNELYDADSVEAVQLHVLMDHDEYDEGFDRWLGTDDVDPTISEQVTAIMAGEGDWLDPWALRNTPPDEIDCPVLDCLCLDCLEDAFGSNLS